MNQLLTFLTEALRKDGKIWVVVVVITIVLLGWLFYLIRIGHRIHKVERRMKL